ncbi:MAG: Signal recognition particle receptor FtsY [Bacteroidetes bacterium ADurb.Bin035]|nr:MAG: Signal recognition particle receptor FtsY [Bacteroidetes bacterium ADurb.Bin035]HNQ19592.1 signal recognition particle-docking protein FtsY [Bacteroidales bacterium]HOY90322.1 signal recognition particle-docking protein FtsY [Bacteroidales bacterium]HPB19540.1 signal recognition particle-docking protein FtsY [Bacteroidales bacterium]HPM39378.1 signal recognition particle-docking protein FtsY [Bacteroidales bacterium]
MGLFNIFKKSTKDTLDKGLEPTKSNLFSKIHRLIVGKTSVDDELLDELEEILIEADVGIKTTIKIIELIEAKAKQTRYTSDAELNEIIKSSIREILEQSLANMPKIEDNDAKPYVILVVGVNGVGKTTTIGKLAYQFKNANRKVVLGAADTFRAAAVEQLKLWAEKVGVDIVERGMNVDPGAVAYETVNIAKSKDYDVAIIDTAGRLHNKTNLMNELGKINRVIKKIIPEAPHEVLLVLDASTGQNAIEQAKQFLSITNVNAIALTKLDGTAKGGIVVAIADELKIPIKYIGVGEKLDDLQLFDAKTFVDSLLS